SGVNENAGLLLARLASEAGAEPLLTSVTASGAAVWSTLTSPKASAIGLTSSAPWRPVPASAMLVVLAVASVSNDRGAFTWPAAVGSNVTEIAQRATTRSVGGAWGGHGDVGGVLGRAASEVSAGATMSSDATLGPTIER